MFSMSASSSSAENAPPEPQLQSHPHPPPPPSSTTTATTTTTTASTSQQLSNSSDAHPQPSQQSSRTSVSASQANPAHQGHHAPHPHQQHQRQEQQQQQQQQQLHQLHQTLPSEEQQRHIAEARDAVVASIGNMMDGELQSRGRMMHANAAALDKQERDVSKATDALRRENEKLAKLAGDAAKRVKELGNVQNWAEVLERDFLVLEETFRLVREGSAGCESCGSGSGSWSGSGSRSGSEVGDGDVDAEIGMGNGHGSGGGGGLGDGETKREYEGVAAEPMELDGNDENDMRARQSLTDAKAEPSNGTAVRAKDSEMASYSTL